MSGAKVMPMSLLGDVTVPSSKSVVHRMLICAALSNEETKIFGRIEGDDVDATVRCLAGIGAEVEKKDGELRVIKKNEISSCKVSAGESGSTLRFMLPIYAALGIPAQIELEGRLSARPIEGLFKTLTSRGASVEKSGSVIKVSGKLSSGKYVVDGSVSSQYISGLLFALPLIDGDSEIAIENDTVSKGYIDLTLEALKKFNIAVEKAKTGIHICGGQKYVSPKSLTAEGDWSSAAFFAAGAALSGNVTLKGIDLSSKQRDRVVIDLLERAGAEVVKGADFVTVKRGDLRGIKFDAENCPDLVPVMASALAFADGISEIKGVDRLKDKESDRLKAVMENLERLEVRSQYADNKLKIYGGACKSGSLKAYGDHRMVMSAFVAALGGVNVLVDDVKPISKSYPSFLGDYRTLGGRYEII